MQHDLSEAARGVVFTCQEPREVDRKLLARELHAQLAVLDGPRPAAPDHADDAALHDPPPELLRLFPSPEFAPALLWLFDVDVLVLLVLVLDEMVDVDVVPLPAPEFGPTVDVPLPAPLLLPTVDVPLFAPEFAPTVLVPLPAPLLGPTVVFVVDTGAVVVVVVGDVVVVVVTAPVFVTGPVLVITAPLPFRASNPRTAT